MTKIAYYRVSTLDQSIESQRHQLGDHFDKEFQDHAVSGAVIAAKRPGFAKLLDYMREGDTVYVTAIDRLGRDSIDIQMTFRDHFKAKGVRLYVNGLGLIDGEMGEFVLALLAQLAQMERNKITSRTQAGREAARASLKATGKTHRGKVSLGRSPTHDASMVVKWRQDNAASIKKTAEHFGVSVATVKRYCQKVG
ncbi:recombinase family protein [Sphingobium sp. H39-3-25]|uniref:recombinase family protein n=1 Tax=Sphingobium arseniciresistens TaxID=3030834 RepID=UPI0023BA2C72|nr:recombinase family protein [Sphingobium arseniciresistens]